MWRVICKVTGDSQNKGSELSQGTSAAETGPGCLKGVMCTARFREQPSEGKHVDGIEKDGEVSKTRWVQ